MDVVSKSTLALNGGTPVRPKDKPWPQWPMIEEEERAAVAKVLETRQWWYGEEVKRFEERYAAYQDAKHCITTTSGTTAIELMLRVHGLKPGDEVIVPPYTFIATASAVNWIHCVPVFVDVDETWCMDPNLIEAAITPRTKAIMPVHFGATCCNIDAIKDVAEKHGLTVFEDACHSWGAKWDNKGTGALGKAGVFSFQNSKNLTSAEGGAILTDDDEFADLCKSAVNCGRVEGGIWYEHPNLGTNLRLTEMQGAILNVQLDRLTEQNDLRRANAAKIDAAVADMPGLIPQPALPKLTKRTYHLYPFRVDAEALGCSRDRFVEACQAEGLPASSGYAIPLYKQPVFERVDNGHDYSQYKLPMAEDLCDRSACWLHHCFLLGSKEDIRDIIDIFAKVKEHAAELG